MLKPVLTLAWRLGLRAGRCAVCAAILPEGGPLCPTCAQDLPLRTGGLCPACGAMSGRENDLPSLCPECRSAPPPWNELYFHGQYTGIMRRLIIGYKFHNRFERNRLLGALAVAAFRARPGSVPDAVVPVPLHDRRLIWRGFNQSLEIARGLARHQDRPLLVHGLRRTRNTPPQTRFGLKERQANIKGAFAADPALVRGKRLLLVDDVYTTGSTLRECARTLKRAGCIEVDVLVLARTVLD